MSQNYDRKITLSAPTDKVPMADVTETVAELWATVAISFTQSIDP